MIDVHWEEYTPGGRRYLRAGEWSLDADGGEDTIEALRRDVEELNAAIDFLEREASMQAAREANRKYTEHMDGYEHATRRRKP